MPILFRQKPKFGPVLMTAVLFASTCALGAWQVKRMEWKNELIQTVESRMLQAPAPLPAQGVGVQDWAYRQVTVSGHILFDKESFVQAVSTDGKLGYRVLTPLSQPGGTAVLIEREWIPYEALADRTAVAHANKEIKVFGTLRYPQEPGWIENAVMPSADTDASVWYHRDIAGMARRHGLELEPFFVEVSLADRPDGAAAAPFRIENVPNNHLTYAITWFALALCSIAIFVLYHRRKEEF